MSTGPRSFLDPRGQSPLPAHAPPGRGQLPGCGIELPVFLLAVGRDHSASGGCRVPQLVGPRGQWGAEPFSQLQVLLPSPPPHLFSSPAFLCVVGLLRLPRALPVTWGNLPVFGAADCSPDLSTKAFAAVPRGVFDWVTGGQDPRGLAFCRPHCG